MDLPWVSDDTYYANEENDLSGELLPCEFCGDLFPAGIFIEHESGCQFEIANKEYEPDTKPAKLEGLDGVLSNLVEMTKRRTKMNKSGTETVSRTQKTFASVKLNVNEDENRAVGEKQYSSDEGETFEDAVDRYVIPNKRFAKSSRIGNTSMVPRHNNSKAEDFDAEEEIDPGGKEYVLSDDEDDAVESIESFWKRASSVLNKRLPDKQMGPSRSQKTNSANNARKKFNEDWVW